MPRFSFQSFLWSTVASVISISFVPHQAQAGFGWTPPPVVQQPQQTQPAMDPSLPPVPPIDSSAIVDVPLLPLPGEASGMKSLPLTQETSSSIVSEPLSTSPAPLIPETAPIVTSSTDALLIEGFGKDVPLAIALRDIVPPRYAFAFSSGVMAGQKISWDTGRGGKPWADVLSEALQPLGLSYQVSGNTVMVTRNTIAPTPSPVSSFPAIESKPVYSPAAAIVSAPIKATGVAVVDLSTKRQWEAKPGKTLRETLEEWCKQSNVVLKWATSYDYPVSTAFYFDGTYGEAVDSLLSSYGGENPAPKGRLYPNLPEGPSILMVN